MDRCNPNSSKHVPPHTHTQTRTNTHTYHTRTRIQYIHTLKSNYTSAVSPPPLECPPESVSLIFQCSTVLRSWKGTVETASSIGKMTHCERFAHSPMTHVGMWIENFQTACPECLNPTSPTRWCSRRRTRQHPFQFSPPFQCRFVGPHLQHVADAATLCFAVD
jgi:hypothetical protein